MLPIGVSPAFLPSIQTSAHGMALIATEPLGSCTGTLRFLPGDNVDGIDVRNFRGSLASSSM